MKKNGSDFLFDRYAGLSPLGRSLVELCSISHAPISVSTLYRVLSSPELRPIYSGIRSAKSLDPHMKGLQSLGLIDHHFRCDPLILERVSRSAMASGQYHSVAKAVQRINPVRFDGYESRSRFCLLLMRDFRIALYTGDVEMCDRVHAELVSGCRTGTAEVDPFVQVCAMPFEKEWFKGLPVELQVRAIVAVFHNTLARLESDHAVLDFALEREFLQRIPRDLRLVFFHELAVRLLMAGRLTEVRSILPVLKTEGMTCGLLGSVRLMEGHSDEASAVFEAELLELRRRTGKRNAYFHGTPGLLCIFALLLKQDQSQLPKVEHLLKTAELRYAGDPLHGPPCHALRAMQYLQRCEPEKAREVLPLADVRHESLSVLFSALASFWLDNRLTAAKIDALSNLFIRARELGLKWLAMECAETLCRAERDTPVRRNFIERVEDEAGVRSLVKLIPIEEPWRKNLRALVMTASHRQGAGNGAPETRLVWHMDYSEGVIGLQPVEQKRSSSGAWTKGRPVSLARFYNGTRLGAMTEQDRKIREALSKSINYYRVYSYRFDMEKALPALVGHPLVFLADSPSVRVEVVRGEPEITVARERSDLRVQFAPRSNNSRVTMVRETSTRFKVIELTEEQRRMARIIGEKGLQVPESGREELLSAISVISSSVMVHSAIGGAASDIVQVEADSTPHVHLLPTGDGFSLEFFAKPFPRGGPYLKPGQGQENVIAEVDGTRLQARRDLAREEEMVNAVERSSQVLANLPDTERRWRLKDPEECLQVLLDLKALRDVGAVVVEWPEGEKIRVTREISLDRMHFSIRSRNDWFEVGGHLTVDDDLVIDMRKVLDLVQSSRGRFIPIGDGQYIALTRELRRRLEELEAYTERRGKEFRLHPLAALALGDLTVQVPDADVDEAWKLKIRNFRAADALDPRVPSTLKADLRQYQAEGFKWLARLAHLGIGACLADDMGLGKTLQALALLLHRAPLGPALVVAPMSVCMNWAGESNRFAPTLNPILFGGSGREEMVAGLGQFDVLICSYGLLNQEVTLLSSVHWNTVVLDEAQAIKNMTTKRSQAAMSLKADFKLITTGTPIENHLSEFWTLFNFINPGLLGSFKRFNERFAIPVEKYGNRDAGRRLKKLVRPFVLRRLKSEVLEELPPRTEVVLHVEMSAEETAFYEALRRQALDRLERDTAPAGQRHVKILAEITRLRLACCNPKLVLPESRIGSSKLELFRDIVRELLDSGHKALVFSQFVGHLACVRELLDLENVDYRYLDGSTPQKDRQREVESFQAGKGDLFLISLRAGGLGLNLTAADYVIHLDPWWNPAVEDQAADRAHRIGQQLPVTVYRLVTRNTIEEKIVKLHQDKRELATSLLDGTDLSGRISAEELLQLIREA